MYGLLVEKQRRQLPYYLCTWLALGLSHEKNIGENQRSRELWTDIVKGTFSGDQWMENFRMTKVTFEILCDDLHPSFPDQARSVREPLQLDHRVAIVVYWIASFAEYRTIANLFGAGKSTVHKCIHGVCTAMAENI